MSRPWTRGALLLPLGACLAALAGCGGEGGAGTPAGDAGEAGSATEVAASARSGPVQVRDAARRTVTLPGPAERVVSLVPSATLTLDALGARDVIVGRTDYDTVLWAAPIPSVGGGLDPNLEAIVALDPDLVVRFAGDQDPDTPERLDELGIPHVAVRPDGVADVLDAFRSLGTLVGRAAAADSAVRALESRLDSIRRAHAGGPAPRVAYVLGGSPPWVAGPGTYIQELIELAGGENAFGDLGSRYASVSPEEFVARDIDVVLVHQPGDLRKRLAGEIPIREVSDVVELPGPGLARAAAEVARLVHGTGPP